MKTVADFLKELNDSDQSVASWCRQNGFSATLCHYILKGKSVGRWGQCREIVKAMGLELPERVPPTRKQRAKPAAPKSKPHYRLHVGGEVELVSRQPAA